MAIARARTSNIGLLAAWLGLVLVVATAEAAPYPEIRVGERCCNCGNDYVSKPRPAPPCCVPTQGADCYDKKPWSVPCPVPTCGPDCYDRKPGPFCIINCFPWYRCTPMGSACK